MDALDFIRHLLDPARLAVVGAVALRPREAEEVAADLRLPARDVLAALAPLVQHGLVERDAAGYRLSHAALRALAHHLPQPAAPDASLFHGMTDDEAQVLARFFRGDRLVELPAQRTKRLVVLERLALEFEIGARYPEREVNDRLRRFHDDTATLRRALVDEDFLDRAEGVYWRSGGRVDV